MKTSGPKVGLPLRVPVEYIERLDDLAERMGLDRSEVARRALRNGMEDLQKMTKIAANPVVETFLRFVTEFESNPGDREELLRVLRSIGEHKQSKKRKRGPATA